MRLKSLELFGFKSFAERTLFEFDAGVTAIVGPNGCGKSNTVDAVKWVLGEQRARSLRGREMTDVIFNGSEKRKSVDFAEVTLRFDNQDRTLPVDEDEVQVARRLYRSGESEYLVNGKGGRLRDVRELFMGTGLGPGGYSFMEQGKIDSVLASNPVDRRRVFEEAAGISRFRARRHETELKLDKVDANLLRLADILEELARQERSLKIQAGKARRFQEFSTRARELQAQVALYRFDVDTGRQAEFGEQVKAAREERDVAIKKRDELRDGSSRIETELAEKSEALAVLREQAAEVAAREAGARDMMSFHRRHLEELGQREQGRRQQIDELHQEVNTSREQRDSVTHELEGLESGLEGMAASVAEKESAVQALRDENLAVEERLRGLETRLLSLQRRQVELSREVARHDAGEKRWNDELARADETRVRLAEELEGLRGRREALLAERRDAAERIAGLTATVAAAEHRLEEFEQELARRIESQRASEAERSKTVARVDAIEGLIARREGLDTGVRSILEHRQKHKEFLPGHRGLLIDLFRADLEQADAVEAALGEVAQGIVVETVAEALEGAAFLATSGRGRAAFLPLEAFSASQQSLPSGLSCDDPSVAAMIGSLLSGMRVMTSDEVQRAVAGGEDLGAFVVTPDGGVIRDGRVFVAGSKKGQRGLVAIRSELETLRARRDELQVEASGLEFEIRELGEQRDACRAELKVARVELAEVERCDSSLNHETSGVEGRIERLAAEESGILEREERAQRELEQIAAKRGELERESDEVEKSVRDAETERQTRSEEYQAARLKLDEAARGLERERVALAGAEQRLEGLSSSASHLVHRHEKAVSSIDRYTDELESFEEDRERSRLAAAEEEKKSELLAGEHQEGRRKIAELDELLSEVKRRHEETTRSLHEVDEGLEALSERLHGLEIESNEVRVNLDNLVEHIRDELDLDLVALHDKYEPAEAEWDAIEAELEVLKEKIAKLGNVNLAAIDDLAEVEERLQFMTAQSNDLNRSKLQLTKVLRDIETESTRMFQETFDRVREHFQVLFRKLFGGGRADIVLVDPENVLESGIEITARPPGKEARSITLLSGGERTMTAVALLFSIIRAHPCPCCLMDEVDAALDEDNTERFCMILEEFLERTQFVLITHARRTMARADTLFGVTMGERGVSRHVGVRFEDVNDDGSFDENGSSERPTSGRRGGRSQTASGPKKDEKNGRPRNGKGNGNGNGNGKKLATAGSPIAGEVVVEMTAAADDDSSGGRVRPVAPPRAEQLDRDSERLSESEEAAGA